MLWYERLLLERRDQELSQREVGKAAKTTHVQVSRIETGEQMPKADTLYRICKALGVSMDDVFKDFDKHDKKMPPKTE